MPRSDNYLVEVAFTKTKDLTVGLRGLRLPKAGGTASANVRGLRKLKNRLTCAHLFRRTSGLDLLHYGLPCLRLNNVHLAIDLQRVRLVSWVVCVGNQSVTVRES